LKPQRGDMLVATAAINRLLQIAPAGWHVVVFHMAAPLGLQDTYSKKKWYSRSLQPGGNMVVILDHGAQEILGSWLVCNPSTDFTFSAV